MTIISDLENYHNEKIAKICKKIQNLPQFDKAVDENKILKINSKVTEILSFYKTNQNKISKLAEKANVKDENERLYNEKTSQRILKMSSDYKKSIQILQKFNEDLKMVKIGNKVNNKINNDDEKLKNEEKIKKIEEMNKIDAEHAKRILEFKNKKAEKEQNFKIEFEKNKNIEKRRLELQNINENFLKKKNFGENAQKWPNLDKIEKILVIIKSLNIDHYKSSIKALSAIFSNIVSEPSFEKYRRLRKENPALKRDLLHSNYGETILRACGFIGLTIINIR
ncbi:hypothetical protein MHBO_002871 [Bonamia ostreae]|uniref:PUB domain-containing protein n=1 Tax=Bonamia ostreae TaxID=126728 RepID=A0ABV2ANS8_9EUKA